MRSRRGLIRTALSESMRAEQWSRTLAALPFGRAGEPSEVADCVAVLASDLASYVSGAVLEVAGAC